MPASSGYDKALTSNQNHKCYTDGSAHVASIRLQLQLEPPWLRHLFHKFLECLQEDQYRDRKDLLGLYCFVELQQEYW